jgi:transcriptional regulator with XRE-family HTH domain
VSERSNLIAKLQSDFKTRSAYIKAKVATIVPSQIRGLRLKSTTPRQPDLAKAAEMHQSRISMLETAGSNPTIGTLSEIAAALNVGLKVEFVPFSEMLEWENNYSQDKFNVVQLEQDEAFLNPIPAAILQTNFIQTWNDALAANISFESGIRIAHQCYTKLSGSRNILNVLVEPTGTVIRELNNGELSFIGSSRPSQNMADVLQATPLYALSPSDYISVGSQSIH